MHQFTVTEFIIAYVFFPQNRIAKAVTLENVHIRIKLASLFGLCIHGSQSSEKQDHCLK